MSIHTPRLHWLKGMLTAALLGLGSTANAHASDAPVDTLVEFFLASLPADERARVRFDFDDPERFRFRWVPGRREGVRLDALSAAQRTALRDVFHAVLSDAGTRKVDAIIATEAALGVIENAPEYRHPGKYWTAVFGEPGSARWALRFEGHHLSVNLGFRGADLVSATPLFLGANPERVPSGPDAGLRALAGEVDLGRAVYGALDADTRARARGSEEWFGGFLTSAGERRADLGKPAGVRVTELSSKQRAAVRRLIAVYVETVASSYAAPYLESAFEDEWKHLRFYWSGGEQPGESYYYRIAGKRLLIEHDNRAGGTHVHAVWRDAREDFGGDFGD